MNDPGAPDGAPQPIARSALLLHGLLRLPVARFGLPARIAAMLLAQIGRMDLAATGLLGVVAVTLTLLGFRRTLLHIVLAEMKRSPPCSGAMVPLPLPLSYALMVPKFVMGDPSRSRRSSSATAYARAKRRNGKKGGQLALRTVGHDW